MNDLCKQCGAYWECGHKKTPIPEFTTPSHRDTVMINGKEYEPPKLGRDANGNIKRKPLRITAAQVEATRETRREETRRQAQELAERFRKGEE